MNKNDHQLTRFRSRSVELYQPSMYNGYFVHQFQVPLAYTRTHTTFPLMNQLSIQSHYITRGHPSELKMCNAIAPWWNIPTVYPLQDRRLGLF
jgi:hypothetical protein